MAAARPLHGTRVAITRPVGTAGAWVRSVRALGGVPLRLPGLSLRAAEDPDAARAALDSALRCDAVLFTSPAAVRFARHLAPLHVAGQVFAPGTGTLRALRRAGLAQAAAPVREDSEGLLELPALRRVRGRHVALVGAAGGRGLLDRELAQRGATVVRAHVYRRSPARLDRRHFDALLRSAGRPLYVLVSSSAALANLLAALPAGAVDALLDGVAVTSSARLAAEARAAGFGRVLKAASAHAPDMLSRVVRERSRTGSPASIGR